MSVAGSASPSAIIASAAPLALRPSAACSLLVNLTPSRSRAGGFGSLSEVGAAPAFRTAAPEIGGNAAMLDTLSGFDGTSRWGSCSSCVSWGMGDLELLIAWTRVKDRSIVGDELECFALMRAWADGDRDLLRGVVTVLAFGDGPAGRCRERLKEATDLQAGKRGTPGRVRNTGWVGVRDERQSRRRESQAKLRQLQRQPLTAPRAFRQSRVAAGSRRQP